MGEPIQQLCRIPLLHGDCELELGDLLYRKTETQRWEDPLPPPPDWAVGEQGPRTTCSEPQVRGAVCRALAATFLSPAIALTSPRGLFCYCVFLLSS